MPWFVSELFVDNFIFNKLLELICLHIVKLFQVLMFNRSNFIHQVFLYNIDNLQITAWFRIANNNNL